MTFFWQYLDFPEWADIAPELAALSLVKFDRSGWRFDYTSDLDQYRTRLPLLWSWFASQGLEPARIGLFEVWPSQPVKYHWDWCPQTLSMNFPVLNCNDQTYTGYYLANGDPLTLKVNRQIPEGTYNYYARENLTEVDRYTLDKPLIMNVKHIHGVHNLTKQLRTSMTVRFSVDPWHLVDK